MAESPAETKIREIYAAYSGGMHARHREDIGPLISFLDSTLHQGKMSEPDKVAFAAARNELTAS